MTCLASLFLAPFSLFPVEIHVHPCVQPLLPVSNKILQNSHLTRLTANYILSNVQLRTQNSTITTLCEMEKSPVSLIPSANNSIGASKLLRIMNPSSTGSTPFPKPGRSSTTTLLACRFQSKTCPTGAQAVFPSGKIARTLPISSPTSTINPTPTRKLHPAHQLAAWL